MADYIPAHLYTYVVNAVNTTKPQTVANARAVRLYANPIKAKFDYMNNCCCSAVAYPLSC